MSENYVDISKMTEDDKQSHINNVETAMDYNIHVSDNDYELYMEILNESDCKKITDKERSEKIMHQRMMLGRAR